MDELTQVAQKLVSDNKGILAADESEGTIQKRFDSVGVENTEENRIKYRQALFSTPELEKYISGVILFDETVWQEAGDGTSLHDILSQKGIMPGIKVDEGKDPAPSSPKEQITKGLDGLTDRLHKYHAHGMKFTKWRAVTVIGEGLPTVEVVKENARRLAEFARLSQEYHLVPIVEPEVLMDGVHDISACEQASIQTLSAVFSELERAQVDLSSMLLKTNFVVPGKDSGVGVDPNEVARKTLRVLTKTVPPLVPGIVFLSGGLEAQIATDCLAAINRFGKNTDWELSFSFGRALQAPALEAFSKNPDDVKLIQAALLERARLNFEARKHE